MAKYLKLFDNHNGYTAYTADTENYLLPNVSYCIEQDEVHFEGIKPPHDYSDDYLTFRAIADGTFKLSGNSVDYSLDSGSTWTTLASNTDSPTVAQGKTIMFKAELTPTSGNGIGTFSSTANFEAEGNVMSLLFGSNFIGQDSLSGKDYAFRYLFSGCTKLTSAENLSLPATTLADGCYQGMFFSCSGLTTTPELPATTLASYCYFSMFNGCRSLTTAPQLLATTLASSCYMNMFQGCTSLATAPELPATKLVNACYSYMFSGCTSLNYIKALFTTTPSSTYTSNWVKSVAASGTFVKNSAATWNVSGVNGVPNGWTVQTASS